MRWLIPPHVLIDLTGFAGVALITTGLGLWSVPLALTVLGVMLLAGAIKGSWNR